MVEEKRARESRVLVLPLPLQGHINPMLQFSKRLASKGLKVTLIITSSIAKSMQGQDSSINLEPIFDGSKVKWQQTLIRVRVNVNEKGIVTKEEVERGVREVLESERSNAIRGNSDKLKRLAKMAVDVEDQKASMHVVV
ncbi:hypothetical protein POTOM_027471 [Populus tomentosa]|uniref:Glycosyltransferase N-terminal domain-containing protein n=1 Tax=Populus tomentosa TaxID=118781 RepID=A0A8X8CVY1_POPTO|nr:hypothetical protein POTOM_027471 [Populus tomentosa]